MIGPYKLLQQIGEGGMGIVYMAEQEQPLRRKVALKIIKPGMDSAQVIARFEVERQALALMDHPNIARVLDAGTTESGRPYFVMELVHGVPITKYCDANKLAPRQRLELFVPVCQAIQHAHQKGIIHRDIKPSNVLVTLHDGQPVTKVIDFGVAKATEQRLTEKTLFTQYGTIVGTLEYMAPEQAEMSGLGVDTRSDIYSLGVLLYELLTGTTPLERDRLREAAYEEMMRLIREDEPPRPSQRISASGDRLATISAARRTEPAQLSRLVCGELDWIVMRCLEKDRTRRYETANGVARDVERYLKDEPVEACPPTTAYKLRKFARKHRAGLATAVGFAALLVLGTAVSAWQAVRATQAEAVALANEQQANANATAAQEKEREAGQQRDEARALAEELRRITYTARMNLAQHAWEEAAVPRALELLELQRPKPGEPDLRDFEWHYLNRLCHVDPLLTLKGHNMFIDSVTFSPDGKRLVSATTGGSNGSQRIEPELKVWDAQTGQELLTLQNASYGSVALSPDGKRLASGSKVWDAQTGRQLLSLQGHTGDVTSVAFSPDGQRLASGSGDLSDQGKPGEVKVWDAQTGRGLLTLKGRTGDVRSVVFSPDGKRLAHGITGGLKDGKRLPGVVKVWDVQTGQELLTLQGGGGSVTFSPDGKRLASRTGRGRLGGTPVPEEVRVWDVRTGQELPSLHERSDGPILFAFSPDGQRLATAGQRSGVPRIKVCDIESGQELFTFQRHTLEITSLTFSPDSKRLASSSWDLTVRVWDLQTGQEIRALKGLAKFWNGVAFSPDGKRLASGAGDWTVKVWDVQKDPGTLSLQRTRLAPIALSPDLRRVAGAAGDNTVKVWDAHTGQEILTLKGGTVTPRLAFSPDGKRLAFASATWDETKKTAVDVAVKVWDVQTGAEFLSLKGHTGWVRSLAFSPDGKRLAGASVGGEVHVWDTQTGQELLSLKDPYGPSAGVAFSPDGKRLASAGKVWDAQSGQELLSLKGGGPVAFSPDGKRLAGGLGDLTVWDAQTGLELQTWKGGHPDIVMSLVFSPNGKRLVSASRDGTVKVWDAQTGQEMLTLKGHSGYVSTVAFSPEGHRLASASYDGTVKFWDATPMPEKP
ncbi:MAG TPA: serine/threonine-protein kinase [Gemmataceae bacterium]|nr:serine/threonine-protein kinase [Gemmataceae bacterium]